jgi:hypothetical protein
MGRQIADDDGGKSMHGRWKLPAHSNVGCRVEINGVIVMRQP